MSLNPLHKLKELEFSLIVYTSVNDYVEFKVADIPQTVEVLSLDSFNSCSTLQNLRSLTVSEMTESKSELLPSL